MGGADRGWAGPLWVNGSIAGTGGRSRVQRDGRGYIGYPRLRVGVAVADKLFIDLIYFSLIYQ